LAGALVGVVPNGASAVGARAPCCATAFLTNVGSRTVSTIDVKTRTKNPTDITVGSSPFGGGVHAVSPLTGSDNAPEGPRTLMHTFYGQGTDAEPLGQHARQVRPEHHRVFDTLPSSLDRHRWRSAAPTRGVLMDDGLPETLCRLISETWQ
jgi:YVTN family beta-propeller protein